MVGLKVFVTVGALSAVNVTLALPTTAIASVVSVAV
jgi:hypothetical protein